MDLYNIIIENGIYIIMGCVYLSQYYPLLSFYMYLKVFSANYYLFFSHYYQYPKLYKWKHLIRLTDTGHYANFLIYFYPKYLPLAHNILFVISFAYYTTTYFFKMQDTDNRANSKMINTLQQIHCHVNHTCPYLIALYYNMYNKYNFNFASLIYSYLWLYSWFCFIWLPWYIITGDPVYSVLDIKTSNKVKLSVITLVHILI